MRSIQVRTSLHSNKSITVGLGTGYVAISRFDAYNRIDIVPPCGSRFLEPLMGSMYIFNVHTMFDGPEFLVPNISILPPDIFMKLNLILHFVRIRILSVHRGEHHTSRQYTTPPSSVVKVTNVGYLSDMEARSWNVRGLTSSGNWAVSVLLLATALSYLYPKVQAAKLYLIGRKTQYR